MYVQMVNEISIRYIWKCKKLSSSKELKVKIVLELELWPALSNKCPSVFHFQCTSFFRPQILAMSAISGVDCRFLSCVSTTVISWNVINVYKLFWCRNPWQNCFFVVAEFELPRRNKMCSAKKHVRVPALQTLPSLYGWVHLSDFSA